MIHEWPKGRVIRTILTAIAIGIGVDFAIAAVQNFTAWNDDNTVGWGVLVTAIVYGIAAVGLGLGGAFAVLMHPKSAQFLIEVEKEMVKVTWPGRADVIRSTIVIAVLTVVLALFIFAVDSINKVVVYDWILGVGS